MKYEKIAISKIESNQWNPNEMDADTFEHLKEEITRIGLVQPILVRPSEDKYEVIDGEHRLNAADELGMKEVPCIVIESEDADAKVTTINMNQIKGSLNPLKYAELLTDLQTSFGVDALKDLIKISDSELEGHKLLQELPDWTDTEEPAKNTTTYVTCPHCNTEFKQTDAEQRKEKE